jgi:hypothetical protein
MSHLDCRRRKVSGLIRDLIPNSQRAYRGLHPSAPADARFDRLAGSSEPAGLGATPQPGIRVAQIFAEQIAFTHRADYLEHPPSAAVSFPDIDVEFSGGMNPEKMAGLMRVRVSSPDNAAALYAFDITIVALVQEVPRAANMSIAVPAGSWPDPHLPLRA